MRHVSDTFLEATLKRGKSLEQFMGGCLRNGERIISHLELRPGPSGIEVWRFTVPDVGSLDFLDIYEFGGEDDSEMLCLHPTPSDALRYAYNKLRASPSRWVNAGVSQEEYADFIRLGRPNDWPPLDACSLPQDDAFAANT